MATRRVETASSAPPSAGEAVGLARGQALYFLHIHKTAGSALGQILDAHFAHREICPARVWPELKDQTAEDLAQYRLFRGHFLDFRHRLAAPPAIITLLRDPVERSVSTYYFIQRNPDHRLYSLAQELSFEEFLHDNRTIQSVNNLQLRWILANAQSCATPHGNEARLRDEGIDLVTHAAAFLDTLDLVGVAERFDEFVPLLYRRMGWPLREWEVHAREPVNVTEGRPRLDDLGAGVLDRILELTALDRELYTHAQARFQALVEQTGHGRPAQPAERGAPHDRVRLSFCDAVPGLGWESPEQRQPDGATYRWIGPSPAARLFLDVPRGDGLTVDVCIVAAVATDVLDSLRLFVDDVEVPLRRRRLLELREALATAGDGVRRGLRGRVRRPRVRLWARMGAEQRRSGTGPTELRFEVAETRPVVRDGEVVDGRRLGVAFEWLTVVADGADGSRRCTG